MKKIFSLLTLVMMAVSSAWAGDVTVTWPLGESGPSIDPAASGSATVNIGEGLEDIESTKTFHDIVFSQYQPTTGDKGVNSLSSAQSLNKYVEFLFTPKGGAFTPKSVSFDIIKIGTGDPNGFATIIDGEGKETTIGNNFVIRRNNEDTEDAITHTLSISGAASSVNAVALRIYIGKLANNKQVGIANVVLNGELISTDAPVLGASDNVALKVVPLTPALTATATISLTGKNLPDGTYQAPVPADEALTIAPATFTVAGGVVNQEFTLTYKPTFSLSDGFTKIIFTVGDNEAVTNVSYSARLEAYEQTIVSEEMTWNWETLTETVELSENTVPSINDEFVFRELDDKINFGTFDAQSIVISKTQYPVRSKKFQNGTIKFIADRPGVITVDFSDTGSSGDNPAKRYLNINGKNTEFYTQRDGTSDRKVSGEIAVPAGEVSITGMDEDGTTPQPLQIFKVTYVPTGDPVSYEAYISYDLSRLEGWAFPRSVTTGTEIAVPYVVETYTGDLNNVVVSLMVNGKVADKQEVSKIAFDEDWGVGDYIGSFTYTAAEEGDLTIQLVLNFDGAALNEGENETEEVTIIVSDTPVIPEIENIAALKAYDAQGKEDVVLTLTNAKVTYVGATSSFVWEIMDYADVDFVVFEDATGGMMWQGSGLGSLVSEGQVLNGKLALSIESVLGDIYATLTNGLDGVEVTDGTVVPLVINDDNIFEWLGNPDWRLVELTNVTFKVVEDEWSREIHLVNDQIEEVGLTDVIGAFDVETLADAVSADAVTGYVYSLYGGFVTAFQPLSITNITTGISSAKATFSAEAPVYNLNGVRVSNPQKGLYIQNGKKVVLK